MSDRLHKLFNAMSRFNWNMIDKIGFDNGIYIVFENGESYHGVYRVTRVGTHNSDGRLRARLKNHFISKNKDGSIFRKNVGKAILNMNDNPYLRVWTMNSSKKCDMVSVEGYNSEYQKSVEADVSKYMCEYVSFVCFPVQTMSERLRLEEGIISELYNTSDFTSSQTWLGKHSTENEITRSGMWLKRGLGGVPLTLGEYQQIELYCATVENGESYI